MLIYLLRHGIAVNRTDPACPPDPERPLTRKGIEKTRDVARALRALRAKPDALLTSPFLRAAQTAEIAAEALAFPREKTRTLDCLKPEGSPAEFWKEVGRLRARVVLCCGHSPHLDHVIAHALGARSDITRLKKSGVACLEVTAFSPMKAWLLWLSPPKFLRALAD